MILADNEELYYELVASDWQNGKSIASWLKEVSWKYELVRCWLMAF
jgi:hypothetical protein